MATYLTDDSSSAKRVYALSASSDKVITYSTRGISDPVIGNWISRIYDYVTRITGVEFQRVDSGGEFTISLEQPDNIDLFPLDYAVSDNGLIRWASGHNTRQYGGIDDQRTLTRAIGNSLGLSRLDTNWKASGNSGTFTTANTIMSQDSWDRGYDFGHTVFFREDDKSALRQILGNNRAPNSGAKVSHIQREKEDLLLGVNGQVDEFYLVTKGMNVDNKDAITIDPSNGWEWYNDYNIPTIANFNPFEGDRIFIDRRLYAPINPISANTILPATLNINGEDVGTSDYLSKIQIDFEFAGTPEAESATILTRKNTIFNDAGKLMLNVNGEQPGHGPEPVTGNGQLLAFVDIVGARPFEFQAEWLNLWEQSIEQDQSDAITGVNSAGLIEAQAGRGTLIGNDAPNTFVFNKPDEFGKNNADLITNFDARKGDKIGISSTAFNNLSRIKLKTVSGKKEVRQQARSKNTFVYDEKRGLLYFNDNGKKGGWGDGGLFAELIDAPSIGQTDFTIL